jgi:plastocyanin
MRKAFFAIGILTAVALMGIRFSAAGANKTEVRKVALQTVLWVSKEAGPKPTVQKFGEVYGFSPSTITVEQGDRVDITIRNLQAGGDDTHTFTLPAFGINETNIPPLGVVHVSFVASKAGVFPFRCEFHKPWMAGQLVVLPRK